MKKKSKISKKKIIFVIIVLLLLAILVGYEKRDKITDMFKPKEPTVFDEVKKIPDWSFIQLNENQAKYSRNGEEIIVTINSLSSSELYNYLKQHFTRDDWDPDKKYFATINKICWVSGNNLICFNANPVPPAILNPYLNKYPPNPGIVNIIFPPTPKAAHCGNQIIEENLGENCEPPEYKEGDKYVCKTKYGDFYNALCAKDICRCVVPEKTDQEFLNRQPPILTPIVLCGNGILDPGEQCEIGIACPLGFACVACRCVRPLPGPARCGDSIIQAGEDCEWAVGPALLIACPKGFTCQPPGRPNQCQCLTEVTPPGGEEMPPPEEEKIDKCRECKVCSLEYAKGMITEIMNIFNNLLISEDQNLENIIRLILLLLPKTEILDHQAKVIDATSESCEVNTQLKAFLEKFKNFINSLIAAIDETLTSETDIAGKSSLENFKAKLVSLRIKIDSKLAEIEKCDIKICETQQNNQWVKVDCDKCKKVEPYEEEEIETEMIEMDLTSGDITIDITQ